MKISTLTYQIISETLGSSKFHMHFNAEDMLRTIVNEKAFEDAREELMSKFGDVEVSLHPEADWFGKIQIEDEGWKTAYDNFCERKAAWCVKYGCD